MLPAHAFGNRTNPRGVQNTGIGALGTRKDAKLSVRWHYLSRPKGMPSTSISTRSSIVVVIPPMKRTTFRRSRSNSSSSFLSVPLKANANRNANAAASAEAVPPPSTAPPEHDEVREAPPSCARLLSLTSSYLHGFSSYLLQKRGSGIRDGCGGDSGRWQLPTGRRTTGLRLDCSLLLSLPSRWALLASALVSVFSVATSTTLLRVIQYLPPALFSPSSFFFLARFDTP